MDVAQQSDNRQLPDPAGMVNAAAVQWARSLCHENLHSLLDAHEDRLRKWAQSSTEWLDRRQDFAAESRRLLLRLQSCEDMNEILGAQTEWAGNAWRRLMADYAAATGFAIFIPANFAPGPDTAAPPTGTPAARPRGAASSEMRKASLDHLLAARGGRGPEATAIDGEAH
jgi:hypothetical protein